MTSRMIREPMKEYSAVRRGREVKGEQETGREQAEIFTCVCASFSDFVSSLSLSCRGGRRRTGASPYITGAVRDESVDVCIWVREQWNQNLDLFVSTNVINTLR